MAMEPVKSISLKAWADKGKKKVIFVQSDEEFIDILFSFLTMPVGTIIRLIRKQQPTIGIGCMNNLFESVEKFDVRLFRTKACERMLRFPRNVAADQCKKLKLNIDDTEPLKYFIAKEGVCDHLSHYENAKCDCGKQMDREISLSKNESANDQDGGVFVKELTQLMISDALEVKPPSTEAIQSLFHKLRFTDLTSTDETALPPLGSDDQVLTLLKRLLVSETPLSETFLKAATELDQGSESGSNTKYASLEEPVTNANGKISVNLIIWKKEKIVLYAEANQDFVDLLFSFLTVPLGFIGKQIDSSPSKACLKNLYKSVEELDAKQFLISEKHKAKLVSPNLAPDFSYENHPLGIEKADNPTYYFDYFSNKLISDEKSPSPDKGKILTVTDPKSSSKEDKNGGFVRGLRKFTVADNLTITRISSIASLNLLKKSEVSLKDIEVKPVNVGREEALRLLVASFVSKHALTNAFLRKPNP